jgi:hypothetical protein
VTADDVKQALYVRHAGTQDLGNRKVPGGWTVIEEYRGIDVVAFSAHSSPQPAVGCRHPRVGYEVKVSRIDYRREILRPGKRVMQVGWCNFFYFAVPAGLLTDAEIAYVEPEWEPQDFMRTPCPVAYGQPEAPPWRTYPGTCHRGVRDYAWNDRRPCGRCEGRGYLRKSRVETEAPTLWVPRDVGLVTVDGRGVRVVKKSPVRKDVPTIGNVELTKIVRWVSARPDPRHAGLLRPLAGVVS